MGPPGRTFGTPEGELKRNPGSTSPLAEIHQGFFDIARPVGWLETGPDMDVKRRIRPFTHRSGVRRSCHSGVPAQRANPESTCTLEI